MIKLKKREYKLSDVKESDVTMLSHALSLSERVFYCWGAAWYKLNALGLVDEDGTPTRFALEFIRDRRKEH